MRENHTIMRKNNKEVLYRAAFRLFLTRPFEGVSISDIEKESGLTRGAVFYYATNKQDLFRQVIEYYILDAQDIDKKVKSMPNCTLHEYIENYINGIERTMGNVLDTVETIRGNTCRAYISTLLQVCSMFPDIQNRYLINIHNDIGRWVTVLTYAIQQREVRKDIDVLCFARLFVSTFYGMSVLDSISQGLNTLQLREQMYTLYNLIKN